MTDAEPLDDLDRAWGVLSRPNRQELSAYPIGATGRGSTCRVALDRYGLRHLLIPARHEVITTDPRPSILSYTVRSLRFGPESTLYVDISCTEPELNAEFDEIVEDILDAVSRSDTPGATATARVARWRRLFRATLGRGMSMQARLGLFAELTVLRELLVACPTLPLRSWTGPDGRPHDFEAPRGCLEVKATGARRAPVIIHGVDQLDLHDGRPLDLLVLAVLPDPTGTTLDELADSVRSMINDPVEFTGMLRGLGWQSADGPADGETFVVAETYRVPVHPGLPRLVSDELLGGRLPSGIVELSYGLDFDVITTHSAPGSLSHVARAATG